jgi:hypothetical protein
MMFKAILLALLKITLAGAAFYFPRFEFRKIPGRAPLPALGGTRSQETRKLNRQCFGIFRLPA